MDLLKEPTTRIQWWISVRGDDQQRTELSLSFRLVGTVLCNPEVRQDAPLQLPSLQRTLANGQTEFNYTRAGGNEVRRIGQG